MGNLFNYMQLAVDAVDAGDECGGLGPIIRIIRHGLFPILQIGIPIILIVLGTLDLAKAVIASDEKEVKSAQSRLIKRCIYAVAVFFIVTIVNLVMSMIANTTNTEGVNDWRNCWNSVEK